MNCLLLELSAAGLPITFAARCHEQRPPSKRTAFAHLKENPGACQGLLDRTQEPVTPMQPSKPERCGGYSHPNAAAAALQR